VFERFTEPARQVVVLAQDEARRLRHNYIGTEHLLLGLLREREGLAVQALASLGVRCEEVRSQVGRIIGEGEEVTTGQIPFTPRAKKVLELSMREALSLGHNYIATEHLLLAIVRENEGVAARILVDSGAGADKVRSAVLSAAGTEMPPGYDESMRRAVREPSATAFWVGAPRTIDRVVSGEVLLVAGGWLLFGLALGIGIFLGWLIWG
jgi:ATP-dependent Clp protease ATP-binding subunit ClpA